MPKHPQRPIADFHSRYEAALASAQLRANLARYECSWRGQRDAGFASYQARTGIDFATMRHDLASRKDAALAELPALVQRFKEAAERAGTVVYEAASAEDARRYVVELARQHGVELVLKGKSMVSEEIDLNPALEDAGLRVVETDFGEYVAQLAGERPSHMTAPIAHKNRYEVAELLNRETGRWLSGEDISELAVVAREQLRPAFLSGQMGITGANILVAETGTVVLVTNEGNARLTTTLPPVHVAIAGYEKLLPTLADAVAQLRLLPRSGTGQALTSYTTFVSGPDRPDRELHVVLLDNGRSRMLADPNFAAALRCIRCGACANVCAPYQVVGGHVFGHIYVGAIGLVLTPFHHGLDNAAGPQSLCLTCNACATVCPVEIPLPSQILDVRRLVVESGRMPWYKAFALAVWARPRFFDTLARLAALLQRPLVRNGFLRLPLPESLSWRTLPALASPPARDRLARTGAPAASPSSSDHRRGAPACAPSSPPSPTPFLPTAATGLTVAYFIQCLTDRFLPEVAEATVRVLEACGCNVIVPKDQHCCGLPAHDAGDRPHALAMARQTIAMLEGVQADYVVTGAASCVAMIVKDYPHIFAEDPAWLLRAALVAGRVVDLTTFLDRVAKLPAGALDTGRSFPVTYNHFCQSHNLLGIKAEPLRLIRDVMGLELREMDDAGSCCGFGGSFSIDHPPVSRHLAERKLANIDATNASIVVTDNPGCILHLRAAAHAADKPLQVLHLAELLDARLSELPASCQTSSKVGQR